MILKTSTSAMKTMNLKMMLKKLKKFTTPMKKNKLNNF